MKHRSTRRLHRRYGRAQSAHRYHGGSNFRQTSARSLRSGNTLATFHNRQDGWWAAVIYKPDGHILASKEAKERGTAVQHALRDENG